MTKTPIYRALGLLILIIFFYFLDFGSMFQQADNRNINVFLNIWRFFLGAFVEFLMRYHDKKTINRKYSFASKFKTIFRKVWSL